MRSDSACFLDGVAPGSHTTARTSVRIVNLCVAAWKIHVDKIVHTKGLLDDPLYEVLSDDTHQHLERRSVRSLSHSEERSLRKLKLYSW